jgi:hypothetical protein
LQAATGTSFFVLVSLLSSCKHDELNGPLGAAPAAQLTITRQPSASAASGVAFAQQPVIQLLDADGNPVSEVGVVVTAAIATGGGTLGGTLTATTNASGAATFFDLSITGTAGDRTLNFLAPTLAGATSATIAISVGAATQLTITTQPSASAGSGVLLSQQPVLQLLDAARNAVNQAGVGVTATIASGGGTLGATTTVLTNASGMATFTDLAITGVIGNRLLNFSATGILGVTSGTITLTPGAATQLTITTQPSASAASGIEFAKQPVLQLRDAAGNAVSQQGHTVTAVIADGGGTLNGATSVVTNANGVASFGGLSITGLIGDRTLSFSVPTLTGATSNTITLTPGTANQLTITTQPSAFAASGSVFAQQPVLQLRDAAGNAVSQLGTVVTASIATGNAALGGTLTASTNVSGVATFTNLSITGTAGDRTLNFSAPAMAGTTSSTITITAGAATQLAMTTQPSASAASGAAFAQQPVLQLRDAAGNAVNQAGVDVTVAIASGGGALGGTLVATTNSSGVATFTDLSITGIIGNRTLSFSAPALSGVLSTVINITPGAPTQLTITTQPSTSAASGVAFAQQPVLQLRDAAGNAVSLAGYTVTAAIASGGGTLGGATSVVTNASGVATFAGLSITGTIGDRTLLFSVPALAVAISSTITLTPGTATQLSITTQPSASAASGIPFAQQPVLQLRDAAGNAVSQLGTVVTAAIATGGGTLGGTLTASTNASGAATFFNLSITGTAGSRTLNFSAPAVTGVTSGTIAITVAATQLTITTQPSASAASSAVFAQQPVLQLRDAGGNAVSQAGVDVTVDIASGGGTLGGTLVATTNSSGVASFTDLSITGIIGNRTLSFSAPALSGVTSSSVNITPGAPTQLTITTQPSASAASGAAFAQQPVLQLRDAAGNSVSVSGHTVTVVIASGGGTLNGATSVVTNASGVATFAGLSITGTIGDRTLSFSAPTLTGVTSNTITLNPGAATQLSITTQPSATATSGVAFAQQPVIQLRDAAGNAVSQLGTVVTAAIATGGGTLGGTLTATTNASGVAAFTDLKITGTSGSRTLNFSAAGLAGATSTTITIP